MHFILKKIEAVDALDDALFVVDSYHHLDQAEVFVVRIQELLFAKRLHEAFETLERYKIFCKTTHDAQRMNYEYLRAPHELATFFCEILPYTTGVYSMMQPDICLRALEKYIRIMIEESKDELSFMPFFDAELLDNVVILLDIYVEFKVLLSLDEMGEFSGSMHKIAKAVYKIIQEGGSKENDLELISR